MLVPGVVSTHLTIGIVLVVLGVIVLALQPTLRRRLIDQGATRTAVRISTNVVVGVLILGFGLAFAAGAF